MIVLTQDTRNALTTLLGDSAPILSDDGISFELFIKTVTEPSATTPLLTLLFQDLAGAEIKNDSAGNLKAFLKSLINLKKVLDQEFWKRVALTSLISFIHQLAHAEKISRLELLTLVKEGLEEITLFINKEHHTGITIPTKKSAVSENSFICAMTYLALFVIGLIGVLKGASEGFNAINSLIEVIPGLSHTPLAFALWGVFVVVGVIMYISFDYRSIAKALGVKFLSMKGALKDCHTQCELLSNNYQQIKSLITQINQLPAEQVCRLNEIIEKIHIYKSILDLEINQLIDTKTALDEHQPNIIFRYIGRFLIGSLGATLFSCAGFFGGHEIMLHFGYLATEPLTIAIAGTIALAGLISYIFLEYEGFLSLIDLMAGTSKKLSAKVDGAIHDLEISKHSTESHILLLKINISDNHAAKSFIQTEKDIFSIPPKTPVNKAQTIHTSATLLELS